MTFEKNIEPSKDFKQAIDEGVEEPVSRVPSSSVPSNHPTASITQATNPVEDVGLNKVNSVEYNNTPDLPFRETYENETAPELKDVSKTILYQFKRISIAVFFAEILYFFLLLASVRITATIIVESVNQNLENNLLNTALIGTLLLYLISVIISMIFFGSQLRKRLHLTLPVALSTAFFSFSSTTLVEYLFQDMNISIFLKAGLFYAAITITALASIQIQQKLFSEKATGFTLFTVAGILICGFGYLT